MTQNDIFTTKESMFYIEMVQPWTNLAYFSLNAESFGIATNLGYQTLELNIKLDSSISTNKKVATYQHTIGAIF